MVPISITVKPYLTHLFLGICFLLLFEGGSCLGSETKPFNFDEEEATSCSALHLVKIPKEIYANTKLGNDEESGMEE